MEFSYKARTVQGKLQSGIVEASTKQAALDVLQRHQLTVISVEEHLRMGLLFRELKWERVSMRELVTFSRSFATLFDAGVPLVEGLRILADQSNNPFFRSTILQIMDDVDGGMKLSQALNKHPKVFSNFYQHMIRAGETSGALQKTLLYLADYTERQYQLRGNIRSAMIYPIFVVVVFIVVFLIMMVFVVPRLSGILLQISKGELPFITKAVLAASNFTTDWILVILFLIGGLIAWIFHYLRSEVGKDIWHRYQLKLPIFGPMLKIVYQARFADTLSTLVRGGIPIIESMQITADVVGNNVYKGIILKMAEEVKAGNTIESVVKQHEEFSTLLTQMIAVGERSGKLEEILNKLAAFFQTEVDRTVKGLIPLIEPILIIVLGVGVGILVASIIIPIYTIILNVA